MLRLGVEGKGAGWRTLRAVAERDSRLDARRLDELIMRAARQADLLEELRSDVAGQIFRGAPPRSAPAQMRAESDAAWHHLTISTGRGNSPEAC